MGSDCIEKRKSQPVQIKPAPKKALDLAEVRKKLADAHGPKYWRSLEELANTEGFEEMMQREFPRHATEWTDAVSRRNFLKVMGASMALAGLSACTRQPTETIIPYVRQPEEFVPGRPLYFATAMPMSGHGLPLLVENHMGRPTKVEGNPEHPWSLGATDVYAQGSVLGLYDPDRSQTVTFLGEVRAYSGFLGAVRGPMALQRSKQGASFRILTDTVSSPTLADQIQQLLKQYPQAKWVQWEPVNQDNERAGQQMAFGRFVDPIYDFSKADVIVSLDAEFLGNGFPGMVRYARQFADRRRDPRGNMNRLYMVESDYTNTGAKADHRLPLKPSEIAQFATVLAAKLGVGGSGQSRPEHQKFLDNATSDLQQKRGRGLVLAGRSQPPEVHALVYAMNQALGNAGQTVQYFEPAEARAEVQVDGLKQLVTEMNAGQVETLLILSANPVFDAPADLNFAEAIKKVTFRVHHGLYADETAEYCQWHIPAAHYLESWSDVRAVDGLASVVQPLIAPLYGGRTAHEVLAAFTDNPEVNPHEVVRTYWRRQNPVQDFDLQWRKWLHDGFIPNTQSKPAQVQARSGPVQLPSAAGNTIELQFRHDASIYDGRFANNGWLMELPRPMTKITWDNAALMNPGTAERLGLSNEDEVEIEANGRKQKLPVFMVPGHARDAITVHLGYGRRIAGRVAQGAGRDVYAMRSTQQLWTVPGVKISKTGETYRLAQTQLHWSMEDRDLIRVTDREHFLKEPEFAKHMAHEPGPEMTLYPPYKYDGYAWAMAIDLNACVGCNACVIACQAENNIPVVGKAQVLVQREMHWLRIDRYHMGDLDNPKAFFQPLPCMHCENAPCEPVCPVGATVHSAEGLNDMVYNRCVGTRYCANNCPYKVRRFNFLLYTDWTTPQMDMVNNPDVTVRSRGVMEKCTYCVQRISQGRIEAEKEGRTVRDGEIRTACQQVCPADAIVFGDKNNPDSRVAKMQSQERNYGLLAEINTRPRTTYLAGVVNMNPAMGEKLGGERIPHGAEDKGH